MLWTCLPDESGALNVDCACYDRLARETERRELAKVFIIPSRS